MRIKNRSVHEYTGDYTNATTALGWTVADITKVTIAINIGSSFVWDAPETLVGTFSSDDAYATKRGSVSCTRDSDYGYTYAVSAAIKSTATDLLVSIGADLTSGDLINVIVTEYE